MPRPTKMKPRIQIGVRCTAVEVEAAKALGSGLIVCMTLAFCAVAVYAHWVGRK